MEPMTAGVTPARSTPDLGLLHQNLAAACRHPDAYTRRNEILLLLVALTNAAAGAYFLAGRSGELETAADVATDRVGPEVDTASAELRRAAAICCESQRLVKLARVRTAGATVLASPIQGREGPIGAISLLLFLGKVPAETFATVLQLTVALAAEVEVGDARPGDPFPPSLTTDLLSEVRDSPDADTACLAIAEGFAEASAADHVALALASPGKRQPTRLTALSGVTEFDRRSDVVRSLEGALSAAPGASFWSRWRAGSEENVPELRAAAAQMNAREIWTAPIISIGSGRIGALAFLFENPVADGEPLRAGIESVIAAVADSLDALRRGPAIAPPGRKRLDRRARIMIGATLAIAAAGLLMLPADHRLTARSVLEPEVRRYVVAPFDGVLETSRFKPGERVATGDVLATLDGRKLELELTGLLAQRDKLTKQRDVRMAAGKTAATQITELELARTRAGLELLEYKRNHLEIRSPIHGVVTQGDLSREEGSPVTTGQRLFELAPLDRMVAEVEVPARDIAYYVDGAPAELTLEAFPQETLAGPVTRLHPRATIRDGRNVYLAEIDLDNPELRLRPGMRGEAKISVGRRPLGWVLFHRAWEKAAQWLR
jgi:multidrug resistance efflux pump